MSKKNVTYFTYKTLKPTLHFMKNNILPLTFALARKMQVLYTDVCRKVSYRKYTSRSRYSEQKSPIPFRKQPCKISSN